MLAVVYWCLKDEVDACMDDGTVGDEVGVLWRGWMWLQRVPIGWLWRLCFGNMP